MAKFTQNPPQWECRQIDTADTESDWICVNVNDTSQWQRVTNADFKANWTAVPTATPTA